MLASVHVLHIVEQQVADNLDVFSDGFASGGINDIYMIKLIEKSKEDLIKLKKSLNNEIEIDLKITTSVTNEIIEYAEKLNADLIVMGSKGTNTLDQELVGSNTEKIVRNAKSPVLTVKEKINTSIDNIVFASDFKNMNDSVLEQVKFYQNLFSSKLHLLRVVTPHNFENTNQIEKRITEVANKYQLDNYTINTYNDFYEEDGISNFASHNNFELICLATSGRTGLSHFFTGSIAEDVVNHSNTPVLTFNLKNY